MYDESTNCDSDTLEGTEEVLIKFPEDCEFCKLSLSELGAVLARINAPQAVDCDPENFKSGFGVRYRNFNSSAAQDEVYLGRGDLGQPPPARVQTDYNWQADPNNLKTYPFELEHFPSMNQITETVSGGSPPTSTSTYSPVIDLNGNIVYGSNIIDSTTLNAFSLNISNRQNGQPNNMVQVVNLQLQTPNGTYLILNPNTNSPLFDQPWSSQEFYDYLWPNDGTTPIDWFRFTGDIRFKGTFGSAEASKVQLVTGHCEI
jgi:hypothetical protein